MSAEKNRCGIDSSKCTDWTTTRRAGYKPGPNEPIEPQYTAMRGFSSTKSGKLNKSGSKKKSAVKTNKTYPSSTLSGTSNKSKSDKRNINSNTSMTRTTAI